MYSIIPDIFIHVLPIRTQTPHIGLSDEVEAGVLPGHECVGDPETADVDPGSEASEPEGVLGDGEPKMEGLHWLPTLSPLSSAHADLSPFWLKKVTSPLSFTTIHATSWPFSMPHASTVTTASALRWPSTTSLNSAVSLIIYRDRDLAIYILEQSSPLRRPKGAEYPVQSWLSSDHIRH